MLRLNRRSALRWACAHAFLLLYAVWCFAQLPKLSNQDAAAMAELHRVPGRVLARGVNEQPTGDLHLKTYILEEVQAARPLQVEINSQKREITRAWRLTISGGPFEIRAMPAMVWLDNKFVGIGVESVDLMRISVIIFDGALLREGASISVSHGEDDPQRTELRERLTLSLTR